MRFARYRCDWCGLVADSPGEHMPEAWESLGRGTSGGYHDYHLCPECSKALDACAAARAVKGPTT